MQIRFKPSGKQNQNYVIYYYLSSTHKCCLHSCSLRTISSPTNYIWKGKWNTIKYEYWKTIMFSSSWAYTIGCSNATVLAHTITTRIYTYGYLYSKQQ